MRGPGLRRMGFRWPPVRSDAARVRRELRRRWLLSRRWLVETTQELGVGGLRHGLARTLGERRFVLAVSQDDYLTIGGGTQLYLLRERSFLAEEGIAYLHLWPMGRGEGYGASLDGHYLGSYALAEVGLALDGLGERACVAVNLHHLLGSDLGSMGAFLAGVPAGRIRFFLHDYHSMCTNYNLTLGGSFCGAPPVGSRVCAACSHGTQRRSHVEGMGALLAKVAGSQRLEVIAPSEVTATLWAQHYPEHASRVRVVPHLELAPDPAPARLDSQPLARPRLAFVGTAAPMKGLNEWIALASSPDVRHRFDLFHFGMCRGECPPGVEHVDAFYGPGDYDAMIRALVRSRVDLAFLWSVWPETFSFTCFEAIAAGAFVITGGDSGNIAAQVRRTGRGAVFADLESARRFLLDPGEVERARVEMRRGRLRSSWVRTLSRELAASDSADGIGVERR